jgi:hypothetical protein
MSFQALILLLQSSMHFTDGCMVEETDAHLNEWALEFLHLNVLPLSRKGRIEFFVGLLVG